MYGWYPRLSMVLSTYSQISRQLNHHFVSLDQRFFCVWTSDSPWFGTRLWDVILQAQVEPSVVSYTSILHAYAKQGNIEAQAVCTGLGIL